MLDPVFACPHSARCGGCAFMGMPVRTQLAHKRDRVERALRAYPSLQDLAVRQTAQASPMLGYRTRAKLVVSASGAVGLYGRTGHEVVDIPECQVLHPTLLAVVAWIRARVPDLVGVLTAIDARLVYGELAGEPAGALVTLAVRAGFSRSDFASRSDFSRSDFASRLVAHPALESFARELSSLAEVRGVAVREQSEATVQLLAGVPEPLHGQAVVRERLADTEPYHYATFGSFVQAHRGQATRIGALVISELERTLGSLSGRRVLELFAGAGALGLSLLARGAQVTLVERYGPALEHAQRAQREQDLQGLSTISDEAERAVLSLSAKSARFDAVIVNPPRRGLRPELRAAIAQLAPSLVVYISCEPTSLARDLWDFARRGLVATQVQPFDMIPLSNDVESVVALQPGPRSQLRVIYEDEQLLVVDKPPHLPTTPDREHPDSLLRQLIEQQHLPELSAVHRLDVGTSGVCLFAKQRAAVQSLAERLRAGEKHYLTLVRGGVRAKGIVRAALREQGQTRPAVSRYTRMRLVGSDSRSHSLVRVRPEQGRTHQVRKHMAAIGHPVLGDARYGDEASNLFFEHRYGLDRTFLHASRVVLAGPSEGQTLELSADLPADLAVVLANLAAATAT